MPTRNSGTSIERLKAYYERQELECPECGHDDDQGSWTGRTDGHTVRYRHECPHCGHTAKHEVRAAEMSLDYGALAGSRR